MQTCRKVGKESIKVFMESDVAHGCCLARKVCTPLLQLDQLRNCCTVHQQYRYTMIRMEEMASAVLLAPISLMKAKSAVEHVQLFICAFPAAKFVLLQRVVSH